jgi:hypothetical protein
VSYDVQPGQNVEYSVAAFITSLFAESTAPAWKLLGEHSTPWLRCTEALQYYEQEKAKAVAVEVQNWVFGEPPRHTLDGRWTLARTLTACQNLVEGCASNPVDVRFGSCTHTQCVLSRDSVWRSPHPIARTGQGTWAARFDDIAMFCDQDGRQTFNPGSYTMDLVLDDTADTLSGTYTYTAATNPPCAQTDMRASFTLVGHRS